jgi:hypothetical protein
MDKNISIYVGCALKHAPEEYKESIKKLKNKLSSIKNVKILEFVVRHDATPKEIYENDIIDCVMNCDLMIADFSHPSLGLGYEVATMLETRNKPVLGFANKNAIVSSLILGIQNKNFSFQTYSDINEVFDISKKLIESHA